jgi:cytochrome P450
MVLQTVATLINFVLTMLLFPEVQYAAQEELDRVVGQGRLPEMEDEASLPYITALRNEVLR